MTYEEKERTLLRTLIDRGGMQHMLDTASEVFGNPVFLCDLGYKIICCSDRDADYDDFWNYMKSHDYSLPEQILEIMRTGDLARVYHSDEARTGQYPFAACPFLAARIRDGNRLLGHLCVYGCRQPFGQQDQELLGLLCRILSCEMLYQGISSSLKIPYYTLFTDLLEGTLTDKEELDQRLKCLKLALPSRMYLAVGSFRDQIAQASIHYLRESLMLRIPDSLGIIYRDRLVLLLPEKALENQLLEKALDGCGEGPDCRVGISSPFDDVLDLKIHYEQALQAIQIAELLKMEERLCRYQRLYIYQILLYAQKETELRLLCEPAVLEMQTYDRRHHTEYLNDLRLYLSCGKNINKAAQKACVHKNSMYYRISKMEEKFGFSLADEETCLSLQLSLKILQLLDR